MSNRNSQERRSIYSDMEKKAIIIPRFVERSIESLPINKPCEIGVLRDIDYILDDHPPINFLVEDLFTFPSVNFLFGKAGIGKSCLAIDLCVCATKSISWLGKRINEKCSVIYYDHEACDQFIANRIKKAINYHFSNKTREEINDLALFFRSHANINFINNRKDSIKLIVDDALKKNYKLIVIDSFIDIMTGGDENGVQDTHSVCEALRTIANLTGACIIVLHHENKSNDIRGSTAITAAADSVVRVSQSNKYLILNPVKARYIPKETLQVYAKWKEDGTFTYELPENHSYKETQKNESVRKKLVKKRMNSKSV